MTFVNVIMIRSTVNIGNTGLSQVFVYISAPVCIVVKGSLYKQCYKNVRVLCANEHIFLVIFCCYGGKTYFVLGQKFV